MEIIKKSEARSVELSPEVIVQEYDSRNEAISGATAIIKGRYPATGYVLNEKLEELVYVLSGGGRLIFSDKVVEFTEGDILILEKMEKYAWDGDMVLFMATAPKFDPAQHKEMS